MYWDGTPGEIHFGSSWREVRVSEGSSYRESTVPLPASQRSLTSVQCGKTVKTCCFSAGSEFEKQKQKLSRYKKSGFELKP